MSNICDEARPWQSYHTVYTNAKAGMEGVDKERVQRVVYEMSKGSKYFENEERKEGFIKHKIDNVRARVAKLSAAELSHYHAVAERRIRDLEVARDLSRVWLHVDMDAFYAAVETLCNPLLEGKPMAVGGTSMISTANYEARKFGVRAAMPGFIARKLCPELIFVPVDFKKYTYYSSLTRKVFEKFDPNYMAASLDEAYLDITDICKFTCSAGVAPNRLLAKVCSDINKPNGQFVLPNSRIAVTTFISSLPIRKIGGIGKVTEHILRDGLGINTCAEIVEKGSYICALFSPSSADFFLSVGLGLGGTHTPEVRLRKSISNERTFSATGDETLIYHKLEEIAENLSSDMQKEGLFGRTLTLKLKTADFEVRTRAVTLQKYICSNEDIIKNASKLLKAELPISLRLIGLRMSQLNESGDCAPTDPTQKTLTNFIVSRDSSTKGVDEPRTLGSETNDHFMNGETSDFRTGSYERCHDRGDLLDCNDNCDGGGSLENFHELPSDAVASAVESSDLSVPECSTNQGELFFWVNGYKCSICGTEMPLDFVEERQEHSDFHLAEKLQGESVTDFGDSILRHRVIRKDAIPKESQRKKQKLSPKHVTIDRFFGKSNQKL